MLRTEVTKPVRSCHLDNQNNYEFIMPASLRTPDVREERSIGNFGLKAGAIVCICKFRFWLVSDLVSFASESPFQHQERSFVTTARPSASGRHRPIACQVTRPKPPIAEESHSPHSLALSNVICGRPAGPGATCARTP